MAGAAIAVVVLVIAVLIAILVPSLGRAREAAREAAAVTNMRLIAVAVEMYSMEYDGRLPSDLGRTMPYGVTPKVLRDPRLGLPPMADPVPGMSAEALAREVDAHSDYRYLGAGLRLPSLNPPRAPLLIAKKPDRRGAWIVGFADGHVESVRPADLPRYMDELNRAREAIKLPPLPPVE